METLNRLCHFLESRGTVVRRRASPGAYRFIITCALALALIAPLHLVAACAHPAHAATAQRASTSATATPVPTAAPATSQAPSLP
ncbi:MAG: hypothetical protein RMJ55_20075, partial [Roseiflexaceae bacterium]|nr:hypothetical protein [Roseiflexaceae bacterium]